MQVLHLSAHDTSTALALFYVSYVIFDCPSNLLMSRLSPRVWMARIVLAVGILGMCFAAVRAAWSVKFLRFLLGVVIAGMWPGMSYYLTLFYPPSRTGQRIGYYFSAAQISAAVVGLVSAGFQKMDGLGGLVGFQWMFLIYGALAVVLGIALLWWLPDRPLPPGEARVKKGWMRFFPAPPEVLKGEDALVHYRDLRRVYHPRPWTWRDLGLVLIDWRLWPLVLMYFGVVGVGIGTQLYGSVIIAAINPNYSDIVVSLLFAPIWIVSLPSTSQHGICQNFLKFSNISCRWILLLSSLSPHSRTASTASAPSSSPPLPSYKLPASSSSPSPLATPGLATAVSSWLALASAPQYPSA